MGEIRPKECEPRELTKDQLADLGELRGRDRAGRCLTEPRLCGWASRALCKQEDAFFRAWRYSHTPVPRTRARSPPHASYTIAVVGDPCPSQFKSAINRMDELRISMAMVGLPKSISPCRPDRISFPILRSLRTARRSRQPRSANIAQTSNENGVL